MKEAQDGLDAESTKQAELEKLEKLPTSSSGTASLLFTLTLNSSSLSCSLITPSFYYFKENAEEDLTLDEKCWQLMNHVIEKRRSTPRYIEKINKKTVQLEKQLIEERAKRTIASVAPSKSVESHFDERLAKRLHI